VTKIACPHILIVEDNLAIADFIESALVTGEPRYQFSHAYDGKQALAQIKALQPDLITLDFELPDIEGYEIARILRSQGDKTPILMLTAVQDSERKAKIMQCGCDAYLTKPFAPTVLRGHVATLLRRAGHDL
jgi:two-component system response regulator MprA